MGKPRKHNKDLPPKVYLKHGAYYFVDLKGKYHRLCSEADGVACMERELAKHTSGSGRTKMPAAIARFWEDKKKKLAPSTAKEYDRIYKIISEDFAEFDVDQVTKADAERFLENHWAIYPTMKHHVKSRLTTFFSWAAESKQGLCPVNPCAGWGVGAPPERKRYVEHDEFNYILQCLAADESKRLVPGGKMFQCLVELLYLTVQRNTDVRLLRWDQITPEGIKIKPTKTARSSGMEATITITPDIAAVLERAKKLGKVKSLYVIHKADGSPYTKSGLASAWARARRRARRLYERECAAGGVHPNPEFLIDLNSRDIRPKALSDAEEAGYSIEDLRKAAVHTSIKTTEKYLKKRRKVVSKVAITLPPRRQAA